MRPKPLFRILALCLAATSYWAQDKQKSEQKEGSDPGTVTSTVPRVPSHYTISAEEAARKNPVKFTETSVERGKKLFLTQCAMCHGVEADGKGELAGELKATVPDFTKPETLKNRTDGELFAIIYQGSEVMPDQRKRMQERHAWQIVNFLRAAGGKKPEKPSEKEPEENVILIPQ